ncbi:hypothetical protein [Methylobacter sp. S3L5C]|uniref:hypothetical protein n=1 Tax=Methylobacter sp. S3L5C TaxID=2839024 RepID=UPI001FAC3A95|nr:hypothetical protein [Methylobacter sp. S3L5C]UOA08360.1 hypothetical protein KKZ03_19490 [Methylobacter sp. S3L5C]
MTAIQTELNDVDLKNLRHMLGASANQKKSEWGYRNYFAAAQGIQTEQMEKLLALNLVEKGRTKIDLTLYRATEAGCKAIGLGKAAILRAMEN